MVHYVMDPSRSAKVVQDELQGVVSGIISCDRYSGYKKFARLTPGVLLAFCWAHQRRDYLNLANSYPHLLAWALAWVHAIGELYHLNEQRQHAPIDSAERAQCHAKLQQAVQCMADKCDAALGDPTLAKPQAKVLQSMKNHWAGLTVFVEHPWIDMDNNKAERAARLCVVGRKNFYGSGSQWSAQLAATMYSVVMSVKLWKINARTWLGAYLQACADNANQAPADLNAFLPWAMDEDRLAWMRCGAHDARHAHDSHRLEEGIGQLMRIYCGREFTAHDIERIGHLMAQYPLLKRKPLSRKVCEMLGWFKHNGELKDMTSRVAMLRMQADGLITLPAAQSMGVRDKPRFLPTAATDPQTPLVQPVHELAALSMRRVTPGPTSHLWNEYIARYHYLGYTPMSGSQMRYNVFVGDQLVALLSFGASAWKLAARERFIGWQEPERLKNLQLVINNARFLILPWVRSLGLASKILSRIARQLPHDWHERYGFSPVLLETFVESERHRGTCYKAANWVHVGQTTGRGKKSKVHHQIIPVKDIWLYPLRRDFARVLCQ